MEKILYCRDKSLKGKVSFPFPVKKTSQIKDVHKQGFPLVIFEERFLKRRTKTSFSKFSNKVCFIHFPTENKDNIKLVQKLKFLGYFTDQDNRSKILFKLSRAKQMVSFKERISHLERELSRKNKRLEEIILVDPLTGVYNWRYFSYRLHQELNRARRHLFDISFIVVDIDYFRQVNEVYGVKAGDSIMKEMVKILNKSLRHEDILTRWREDEFFIILPHIARDNAYRVAERIKSRIAHHKFKYRNLTFSIKVSAGVVSFPEDKVFNSRDIVSALSNCLSIAKREGGERVVAYSPQKPRVAYKAQKEANVGELRQRIDKLNNLLVRDLLEMIYGFARAIEAKDHYTGEHVEDTASIAEKIAKEMKLPPPEIENIKQAATLHDLGKVGIDETILSKKGALTKQEREVIQNHPLIAAEILREIHALRGAIPAILYHHERYDGSGYPLGLKGEAIPLSARIVAVADVYQALVSDRPYRGAYGRKEAKEIIKREMGKHFDPKIAKVFLKVINKINRREHSS